MYQISQKGPQSGAGHGYNYPDHCLHLSFPSCLYVKSVALRCFSFIVILNPASRLTDEESVFKILQGQGRSTFQDDLGYQ
jgi:hypothetical protein